MPPNSLSDAVRQVRKLAAPGDTAAASDAHLLDRFRASGDEAATGLQTVVTWTLAPYEGGVLVRMEQAGFKAHEERNYQGAMYGWQRNLGELERVVAGMQ